MGAGDKIRNKAEEAKGQAKVTAGKVLDDEKLKAEGHAERAKAKAKDAAHDAKEAAGDAAEGVRERFSDTRDDA